MEPALVVGQGFFPLDEELGLLKGSLTPQQHEHLVHLAAFLPIARVAQMLKTLLGVQVSEPTIRRQTLLCGVGYETVQTAQSQERMSEPIGEPLAQLAFSTDGAYVPLVGGEWAEVRTVVIGEVQAQRETAEQAEVHVSALSCFSRMTDALTFGEVAQGEMQRRGVSQAERVCAVTDGADWIQGFIDLHRPDSVRILDFPHVAEHGFALLEALQQAGVVLPKDALERCLHVLKHRGPTGLLAWLEQLPEAVRSRQGVHEHLGYFRKRMALMQYPLFQKAGWPIGSGMVESANKLAVQARDPRSRDALVASSYQSYAGFTQCCLQPTLLGSLARCVPALDPAASQTAATNGFSQVGKADQGCAPLLAAFWETSSCCPKEISREGADPSSRCNSAWLLSSFGTSSLEKTLPGFPEGWCKKMTQTHAPSPDEPASQAISCVPVLNNMSSAIIKLLFPPNRRDIELGGQPGPMCSQPTCFHALPRRTSYISAFQKKTRDCRRESTPKPPPFLCFDTPGHQLFPFVRKPALIQLSLLDANPLSVRTHQENRH